MDTHVHILKQNGLQCTKQATEWTIKNCRPFNLIADSGLKNIAQFFISVCAKLEKTSLLTLYSRITQLYRKTSVRSMIFTSVK